jgi:hypothetical protein
LPGVYWLTMSVSSGAFSIFTRFGSFYSSYLQHVAVAQTRWVGGAIYRNIGTVE